MAIQALVGEGGRDSENDKNGAALEILTVVLAGVSLLLVLIRGLAKLKLGRTVEWTDVLLPAALVVALGQSTCVRLSLSTGLGRHITSLSKEDVVQYQQLTYTSNLLFQLALSLTQVFVVLLVRNVEPQRPIRLGCNYLLALIAIYSTLALSVLAFQCSLPEPWAVRPGRCIDRELWFTSFIAAGIVADVATLVLPVVMMFKWKTSNDKKIFVCGLFGTRLALPLVTVPALLTMRSTLATQDPTWALVPLQIWVQVVMNVSIITACLPSLGHVLWEIWAFGSNLKNLRPSSEKSSRDFGHELGLEQDSQPLVPEKSEKPYIHTPVLASPLEKKHGWGDQLMVQIREAERASVATLGGETGKELPRMPHPSAYNLPARTSSHQHHYRRPVSTAAAPPRRPPPLHLAPQHPTEGVPSLPVSPKQMLHYISPTSPRMGAHPPPPPLSSIYSTELSYCDEDRSSETDIPSYYLGNMHMARSLLASRSEYVLQSMIDDLQRENARARSNHASLDGGWI